MSDSSSIHEMDMSLPKSGVYAVLVHWSLIVAVFLTPIFFLPWTTSVLELNKQLLLIVLASVGLVAWLLSLVSTGQLHWRTTVFDKGILAVLLATIIGTAFSIARFNSLFGLSNNLSGALITISALTIIYFLIVNTTEDQGRKLTAVFSFSVTLALLYGLLQIFGVYIFTYLNIEILKFTVSHAFNSVGSVNGLGLLGAISLPLFAQTKSKISIFKYLNILGFVVTLALLIILNWWILWLVAIASMVGVIAFESLIRVDVDIARSRFSTSRFILPMTVIVLGVFFIVVNFNLISTKKNLPIEIAPSFRLSGHVTKSVLKENLVTGYGPETFSLAFDKYGASRLADSTLSSAKFFDGTSEVFNAVTQGGLLMILALLVMAWAFIQGLISYVKNKHAITYPGAQAVWATLIAVGAALLLYPFNITLMFTAFLVLALASLALWGDNKRAFNVEDNITLSLVSSLGFVAGLILVLVGVYFGLSIYLGDAHYAQALNAKDINKTAANLVSAVNWNSHNDEYYRAASQTALGLLTQELKKPADLPAQAGKTDTKRQTRIQTYMSSAVNLAKTATTLAPYESANWENLGIVYQSLLGLVDGVDKLSESAYLKAIELRPGDATFYNEIGNFYLTKATLLRQLATNTNASQVVPQINAALASAEMNFKKAIDISNNFGLAIYNLGVVYDQEGKLPDAIKQLERIAPFNSDQPNLVFKLGLLYYRNGDKDKAFDALQKVLVLQPDSANAHWYLSLIYEERKDVANAISQLKKILALEVNKNNQTVIDRLNQLQSVPPVPGKGVNQKPL